MEGAKSIHLGQRIRTTLSRADYKRWPYEACSRLSGTFILSPPDHFGYMEDPILQVALATYVGQAYPLIMPVVGRYFEKKEFFSRDVTDKWYVLRG